MFSVSSGVVGMWVHAVVLIILSCLVCCPSSHIFCFAVLNGLVTFVVDLDVSEFCPPLAAKVEGFQSLVSSRSGGRAAMDSRDTAGWRRFQRVH